MSVAVEEYFKQSDSINFYIFLLKSEAVYRILFKAHLLFYHQSVLDNFAKQFRKFTPEGLKRKILKLKGIFNIN